MTGKIKRVGQLLEAGFAAKEKIDQLEQVARRFSLSITPQMAELIDAGAENDPIARQFVPSAKELEITMEELADPIGDDVHSPVKGIVHRYPDRCLFMPMTVCPVYCRFCFRREKVGSAESGLSRKELEAAFVYIQNTSELWEVIISGGDPLFMPPRMMRSIIDRLSKIDHVKVIRIHTRVPIVDSGRIDDDMIEALKTEKALYVVLHANHANEFTEKGKKAVAKIVDAGMPMLGQSVLLKGINDDPEVLEKLFRTLVENRIKPYYLHHGDFAKGTGHFRTTIKEGQALMQSLQGKVSGLCRPEYVLDIPGGFGKVPINRSYVDEVGDRYIIEDSRGGSHQYPP